MDSELAIAQSLGSTKDKYVCLDFKYGSNEICYRRLTDYENPVGGKINTTNTRSTIIYLYIVYVLDASYYQALERMLPYLRFLSCFTRRWFVVSFVVKVQYCSGNSPSYQVVKINGMDNLSSVCRYFGG